jgi:pyruvate dehydrogenase E1 component alpha subunit
MNKKVIFNLFKSMYRIRSVEEAISKNYKKAKMRCPTHLSTGQEAVSSAFSLCIKKNDFAVSTHRGHAHFLAKGGNLNSMIAEIYGKSSGCSKGKGGSMHLIDLKVNFMGTSAIVGNSIPVGVGLGLSAKLNNTKQISTIFFGDGAIEEGVFYESLNFAVLKKLPVLFICENNLYSVYSNLSVRQPTGRDIYKMVSGMGIQSSYCDGNDPINSYNILKEKIKLIRNNLGPQFIEFSTYRWREHCGPEFDNHIGYRTKKEFMDWKKPDPLKKIIKNISDKNLIKDTKTIIQKEIRDAFKFAEKSSFPKKSEAFKGVYASL